MAFFQSQQSEEGEGLGPPPGPFQFRRRRRWRLPGVARWAPVLVAIIVLLIIAYILKGLYANWLWFDSIDYLSVYRLRLVTRVWLFFAGAGVFLAFFGANALLALRQASQGEGPSFGLGEAEPGVRRITLVLALAAAIFLAVIFGAQASGQWDSVLLFINSQPFGERDPVFNTDIGFYVFQLPLLHFIVGWSLALVILTTIIVAAVYAFRPVLSGFEASVPATARPHISLLLVAVLGLFVWRYWLDRFELVYSERGAAFGAGYTDLHAQLPVIYVLMGLASLAALLILVSIVRRGLLFLPVSAIVLWVVAAIAGGMIYPATIQRFQVEPNELVRERTYIQRNIDATRVAYGLDRIQVLPEELTPSNDFVTQEEIDGSPGTIKNIRLWDHRPLLTTLNQRQSIRPFYDFVDVDVDRYEIDGEMRQVMLAARELNHGRLTGDAQKWVNNRLAFTHGFGLAMAPVNEVQQEGLPAYFISDLPPRGKLQIEQPRVYYGEMPDHYVIVNTDEDEFDYQSSDEVVTNRFTGDGGVRIDSLLRRIVYAWEFTDTNILISDALSDESRVLYRRNIRDRVDAIAPFLRLDSDPYLVVADGRLFWIQDAYTATDRYPYSTRTAGLNYIRNSVKVVVNAYDGTVSFYLIEPDDPIAQVYQGIYPDLFTPFEEMPASLRAHLRYPLDLFSLQAQLYRTYHISNADAFFKKEDIWEIPQELFFDQQQPIQPYYVIMRLPGEEEEEFALILPFSPANRTIATAWLAARSDEPNYGTLLTFRIPPDRVVFGPSQVESRIDQDTVISQQISLWNRSGSQVIRGNLLMIPIGEGNLFVEPIYLQATASQLPELKRVIVVNGDRIAMEETLDRSLAVVLGEAEPSAPVVEGPGGEPVLIPTPTLAPDETPIATPAPEETPVASPTPAATPALPGDVASLVEEANSAFERAQQLLQQGDFAGYGAEIERLEEILARLVEMTADR